jgi:hypothetical protein
MADPTSTLQSGSDVLPPTTSKRARPVPKDVVRRPDILERVGLSEKARPKFIGHGMYANVYDLGDGRVLKLTYDKKDALAFANILHRPAPAFAVILDVFQVPIKPVVYGIVAEKLKPLPASFEVEWSYFTLIIWFRFFRPLGREQQGINVDWAKTVASYFNRWGNASEEEKYSNREIWPFDWNLWEVRDDKGVRDALVMANVGNPVKLKFLISLAKSLAHARIKWWDLHQGNIMIRPGGRIVIADLGLSTSPRVKIPVLGKSQGPRVFDVAAETSELPEPALEILPEGANGTTATNKLFVATEASVAYPSSGSSTSGPGVVFAFDQLIVTEE